MARRLPADVIPRRLASPSCLARLPRVVVPRFMNHDPERLQLWTLGTSHQSATARPVNLKQETR